VEAWAAIPVRVIVRAAVVTGGARVCDFSGEDRVRYDLDNLKLGTGTTSCMHVFDIVVVGYEDT
jgi:hypothetical protein